MQEKDLKTSNGFPSTLAMPSIKKTDEYGVAYANSIEEEWFKENNSNTSYEGKRWQFQEYRAYRNGNQSEDKYKKYLNPTGDTSWINLDYKPIAIIPKFVDIVKNAIVDRFYRVAVDAIDPNAASQKDKERNKIAAKMILKQTMTEFGNENGAAKLGAENIPQDKEELDFLMSTNFKLAVEIALEQALDFTLSVNNFKRDVFEGFVDDLITYGIGAARSYTHPHRGAVIRYIDPINLVHSYARTKNFSDIVYAGEVIYRTISEIREQFNVSDEKLLEKLAKKVANRFGNGSLDNYESKYKGAFDNNGSGSQYPYDKFKVRLLDFEFKTSDEDRFEKKNTRYGNSTFTRKADDYKSPENSTYKRTMYSDFYECVYGGYKVVDSDIIFDYGKKTNVKRKKNSMQQTELSFKIRALNLRDNEYTGYLQRMMPFSDQMMRSWLKIQQIQQKQRPPGVAIDITAMDNVDIGTGGKLSGIELLDILDQTGNLIYRGQDLDGTPSNQQPIRDLAVNYTGLINEQVLAYNHALQQLRDVTGLNEFRDGSAPSPEQSVGVAEIAMAGSNNATKHIDLAAFGLVEDVADDLIVRIQDIIEYSPPLRKVYEEAIGRDDIDTIKMMKQIPLHLYGIMIEIDLNQDEKMELARDMQIALQAGQIDISDKYKINQMRNFKDMGRYLAMKVKRNTDRLQQERLQNIQAQAQANQEAEQIKMQGQAQLIQVEYTAKEQFEAAQHMRKMAQIAAESAGRVQEEVVRGKYDMEEEKIQAQAKVSNQQYLEGKKDSRMREEKTAQSLIMKEQKSDNPKSIDFTEEEKNTVEDILQTN